MPRKNKRGAKCSSGCRTKDHQSYHECLNSKGVGVTPTLLSSAQKTWDSDIHAYKDARRQGISPAGTSRKQINDAVEISQRTGHAFDAANPIGSING